MADQAIVAWPFVAVTEISFKLGSVVGRICVREVFVKVARAISIIVGICIHKAIPRPIPMSQNSVRDCVGQ